MPGPRSRPAGNAPLNPNPKWPMWVGSPHGQGIAATPQTYNVTCSDAVTFSESVVDAETFPRDVTDSVTFSEAIDRNTVVARAIADALTFAESVIRPTTTIRTSADAVTFGESLVGTLGHPRSVTDSATFSEALARQVTNLRSRTDSVTLSESLARTGTFPRALTDAVTFTESIAKLFVSSRSVTDAVTLSESAARVLVYLRTRTDALTFGESVARTTVVLRSGADNLTFSESLARIKASPRNVTDSVTLSEALARSTTTSRAISDAVTLASAVVRIVASVRSGADALTFAEALVRAGIFTRAVTGSITLSDVATRGATYPVQDSLTLATSVTRTAAATRSISDAVSLATAVTEVTSYPRAATGSIILSESLVRAPSFARALADTRTFTESLARSAALRRDLIDADSFAETASRSSVVRRLVVESVTASESLAKTATANRATTDAVAFTEALLRSIPRARACVEAVTLDDSASRVTVIFRDDADGLSITDILTVIASSLLGGPSDIQLFMDTDADYLSLLYEDPTLSPVALVVDHPELRSESNLVTFAVEDPRAVGLISIPATRAQVYEVKSPEVVAVSEDPNLSEVMDVELVLVSVLEETAAFHHRHTGTIVDLEPPTIKFVQPAPGETIFGNYPITIELHDAVSGVFFIAIRMEDPLLEPFTAGIYPQEGFNNFRDPPLVPYLLDTTVLADGPHSIYVRALDQAGNMTTPANSAGLTFNVNNVNYLADVAAGVPGGIAGLGYSKVYEDQFDTPGMGAPSGWTEKIWYDNDPDPLWVGFHEVTSDGHYHLRTKRSFIWHNPGAIPFGLPGEGPYPMNTSTTLGQFQFQYGYAEARLKWTDGQGAWPSFWLYSNRHATNPNYPDVNHYCLANGLPESHCLAGEIDIFEGQGGNLPYNSYPGWPINNEFFFGTIHRDSANYPGYPDVLKPDNNSMPTNGLNLTLDFHTYAVKWTPDEVSWYLDDRFVGSTPAFDSLNQPMFMLLQMWTGGWTFPLSWTDPALTPDTLETEVDWVRVWQQPGDFHSFS